MGVVIGIVVLLVVVGGIVFAVKSKGGAEPQPSSGPRTTPAPRPMSTPTEAAAASSALDALDHATSVDQSAPAPGPVVRDDPVSFTQPSKSLPRLGLEPSRVGDRSDPADSSRPVVAGEPVEAATVEVTAEEAPAEETVEERFDRFSTPGERLKKAEDPLLTKPLHEVASGGVGSSRAAALDATAPSTEGPASAASTAPDATSTEDTAATAPESDEATKDDRHADIQWIEPDEPVRAASETADALAGTGAPVDQFDGETTQVPEGAVGGEDGKLDASDVDAIREPAAAFAEVLQDGTSEPEPVGAASAEPVAAALSPSSAVAVTDPVDHVLNALIDRARERNVGIATVAAELVEQADLEDKEVDEVLADLLGVSNEAGAGADEAIGELTLFSTEVPQRPGQLNAFDRLASGDKKRALIRVLCLLVALQEDQRLEPREPSSAEEPEGGRQWPLARAVWPTKASRRDEDDPNLPARGRKGFARSR